MLAAPVWVALVLKVAPAVAEAPGNQPPNDDAAVAYQAALDLHAAGDLKGALASMMESYRLSQRDELLYNIAKIEAELGDCSASLTDYRRYVERVPTGRFRESADSAARELETSCGSTNPSSKESPPAEPAVTVNSTLASPVVEHPPRALSEQPETPRKRMMPWLGWSAVATGGLAGLGAVYFTIQAVHARAQFKKSVDEDEQGGARYDPSLEEKQHRDQRWAQVLGVAGGALATGGVLWLVLAPREHGGNLPTAEVHVAPGVLTATWRQSF